MVRLTDGRAAHPEAMKAAFLELYPDIGSVTDTCKTLCLNKRTLYHWRKDPDFETAFKAAEKEAIGLLEDEAFRRAVTGVKRPVFQGGQEVGTITEYSDTLLIVLLKAKDPARYRERFSAELTDPNGKPLFGDMKLVHVHSAVPLASSEQEIDMTKQIEDIPHEEMNSQSIKPTDAG